MGEVSVFDFKPVVAYFDCWKVLCRCERKLGEEGLQPRKRCAVVLEDGQVLANHSPEPSECGGVIEVEFCCPLELIPCLRKSVPKLFIVKSLRYQRLLFKPTVHLFK